MNNFNNFKKKKIKNEFKIYLKIFFVFKIFLSFEIEIITNFLAKKLSFSHKK